MKCSKLNSNRLQKQDEEYNQKLRDRIEKLERLLSAMKLVSKNTYNSSNNDSSNFQNNEDSLKGTSLLHSPYHSAKNCVELEPLSRLCRNTNQSNDYTHTQTLLSLMEEYHRNQNQREDKNNAQSINGEGDNIFGIEKEIAVSPAGKKSASTSSLDGNSFRNSGRVYGEFDDSNHVVGSSPNGDYFNRIKLSSADGGAGIPIPLTSVSRSNANKNAGASNISITKSPFSNLITKNTSRPPKSPSDTSVASVTSGIGRVMASPALKPVSTVLDYVKDGMTNRHQEGKAEHDSDIVIQEFLRVPFRAEVLLMFGLLVCVDCFLYVLIFLPLKFIWSAVCLFRTIFYPIIKREGAGFQRRHFYHVVQIAVIVIVSHILNQVSIGRLYHWIRVQAMIKLYVIVAMIDVLDRLLISFGKDATDSLYWNIHRRPYHPRCIASVVVVLCYTTLHALLLFVHAATVNVALNSADAALLSLLVSGNFAEIKSTVFKNYKKKNLFDITTGDINERFKLFLFLLLIFVLNVCQGKNEDTASDFAYVGVIVFCSEIVADWIKHCFITKLNLIKSDVYVEYRYSICMEITGKGAPEGINMDHTHNIVRRLGLAQIPLACVLVRYLSEAAKYSTSLLEVSNLDLFILIFLVFTILFIIKICIGIVILNLASYNLSDHSLDNDDNMTLNEYENYQQATINGYRKKPLHSISMQQLFHGGFDKVHME